MKEIEINEITIEYMPLLMQQLKNYISINYEENSDYSNYSLVQEYHLLKRNNNLHYLHQAEYQTSAVRLKYKYDQWG